MFPIQNVDALPPMFFFLILP